LAIVLSLDEQNLNQVNFIGILLSKHLFMPSETSMVLYGILSHNQNHRHLFQMLLLSKQRIFSLIHKANAR
jgi:membrane protein DedA with SNARE-associated domain